MMSAFRTLLEAAVLAPSGDNLQPWRFEVDIQNSRIIVHVDENRDQSPMNADQRMSRIAVGAAVENIIQTAQFAGCTTEGSYAEDGSRVTVVFLKQPDRDVRIPREIHDRVTNRRFYDPRPLPAEILKELETSNQSIDGIQMRWMTARAQIDQMAQIITRADQILFGISEMRRAFLDNVRFDRPENEPVDWGLSLGSLEVKGADRIAFRMLPRLPEWMWSLARIPQSIGKKSGELIRSASGLCVFSASAVERRTDFLAGRAIQRAWLALTKCGLAVQPMSSLVVLRNAILAQSSPDSLGGEVNQLIDRTLELANANSSTLLFLLRFGFSEPPSAKTGRLAL